MEHPKPGHLKGEPERKWTAIVQGVCGILAIACGIAAFALKPGEECPEEVCIDYGDDTLRNLANSGSGIWGGLIFAGTALVGLVYRRKKSVVSVYAATSLVSVCLSVGLISAALNALVINVDAKHFGHCSEWQIEQAWYPENERNMDRYFCCYHQEYECHSADSYGWPFGSDDYWESDQYYLTPRPSLDPYRDYDSPECVRLREHSERVKLDVQQIRTQCQFSHHKLLNWNLLVYGCLLAASVIEFLVGVYAAVYGFIAVCSGCGKNRLSSRPQMIYLAPVSTSHTGYPDGASLVVIPNMTSAINLNQAVGGTDTGGANLDVSAGLSKNLETSDSTVTSQGMTMAHVQGVTAAPNQGVTMAPGQGIPIVIGQALGGNQYFIPGQYPIGMIPAPTMGPPPAYSTINSNI